MMKKFQFLEIPSSRRLVYHLTSINLLMGTCVFKDDRGQQRNSKPPG